MLIFLWGSGCFDSRGRAIDNLIDHRILCVLNNGSTTFIRGPCCASCIDPTFTWFFGNFHLTD